MTVSTGRPLLVPGRGRGLLDVLHRRYLLELIVRKELRVRYWGSALGLAWSYVKPAVQFAVFYFAMGVFLQLNRNLDYFAVYLFSGIVVINFFGEAFSNATRTLVWNAPLIKKIYLPRELFPVAAVIVAVVHLLPQLAVLVLGALVAGWRPGVVEVLAALAGFTLVSLLALALGMLFGAVNVYLRDAENLVDLLVLVATWASPVLYPWTTVRDAFAEHPWVLTLYQLNPITVAVELFHRAFWVEVGGSTAQSPDGLWGYAVAAGGLVLLLLVVGGTAFRRLEGGFAQEM